MTPYEALTENDKRNIKDYIEAYGGISHRAVLTKDLDYILQYWDANKEEMFHMMGDQLTLKRTFTVDDNGANAIQQISAFLASREEGTGFYHAVEQIFKEMSPTEDYQYWTVFYSYCDLFNAQTLYNNKTIYKVEFKTPDGTIVKFNEGTKVMRVLRKIADVYGLTGYEAFRNAISRFTELRQKEVEITLSIHPLDFMTMSDNNNDWESCMNWQGRGGYRAGTVEMMNSDKAILAYISTKDFYATGDFKWNSKSWRELFIIHPNVLASVKGYPYQNPSIERVVLNWITELVKAYNGKEYYIDRNDEYHFDCEQNFIYWPGDKDMKKYQIDFTTSQMYNDFGNDNIGTAFLSKDIPDTGYLEIYYSGPWSCMCCGSDEQTDRTDALLCDDCDKSIYCEWCGDQIFAEDVEEVDGKCLCPSCVAELPNDIITDEVHSVENLMRVYLTDGLPGRIWASGGYCWISEENVPRLIDFFHEGIHWIKDCSDLSYFEDWNTSMIFIDVNDLTWDEINKFKDSRSNFPISSFELNRYQDSFA